MKISAINRGRLTAAAMIFAGAIAVVGALTPAASDEIRPFLQAMGIISCSSNSPCQEGKNAGKGAGLEGISAKGSGVIGQSTSGVANAGIKGTSTNGIGVIGNSTNNSGVQGTSTSSDGVVGTAPSGRGIVGQSTSGSGVVGLTDSGIAVYGQASTNYGVFGRSTTGIGVGGFATNGAGVLAVGGLVNIGYLLPALSINGNANNPDLIYACISGLQDPCSVQSGFPTPQFAVANTGNLIISGLLFSSGPCSNGCEPTRSSGEKRVRLFTPQESLPTVEDFGETQLVGGQTYVRIDPAFAKTTDNHAAYMVFITPEGDSNGLYVINKTAAGFEVRENKGGRSTLAFSYRIVAKPFGQHPARLQMITVTKPGMSLPTTSHIL